jgi:hypothetical protein
VRVFVRQFNNEVGRKSHVGLALRDRQLNIRKPIFPMPELGRVQPLIQRMFRSTSHWNIAAIRHAHQFQRVFQALLGDNVARHHGDRIHL